MCKNVILSKLILILFFCIISFVKVEGASIAHLEGDGLASPAKGSIQIIHIEINSIIELMAKLNAHRVAINRTATYFNVDDLLLMPVHSDKNDEKKLYLAVGTTDSNGTYWREFAARKLVTEDGICVR